VVVVGCVDVEPRVEFLNPGYFTEELLLVDITCCPNNDGVWDRVENLIELVKGTVRGWEVDEEGVDSEGDMFAIGVDKTCQIRIEPIIKEDSGQMGEGNKL